MKTNTSTWVRRLAGFTALLMIFMSNAGLASARILFQDDDIGVWESDSIQIGSNDAGAVNTKVTFGADGTAAENGVINWNITTNTFEVDHTTAITGGLSATGQVNFSGAAGMRIREVADEAAASCATVKEIVLDTTENKIYVCTVIGAPGTWVSASSSTSDFEAVYAADADKSISVTDNLATAFEIKEGANSYIKLATSDGSELITLTPATTVTGTLTANGTFDANGVVTIGDSGDTITLDSSDWDITATGDMTGIGGITMDGNFSQSGATTFGTGTGAVSLNGATTVANGNTFTANGIANIGDGGDTVAINSSDWDITTTGVMSGIASIAGDDNQATLNTNLNVTGADAGAHTLAFQIDGNSALTIAATGDGAGGVGARTVTIGASAAADTVTIGDANAIISVDSATWDISTAGAISGVTTIGASGNITTSGGTFIVGTTALNETTAANDSGAFLVGTFDEFDNSASTNVQDVLDDLDALIGSNADNVEILTFYPEYPDTVVWPDTSNNAGTLSSLYDDANDEHYYHWTSNNGATQDMDLKFRYLIPADFASTGDLTYRFRTGSAVEADNDVEVRVYDATDAMALCGSDTSNVNAGAWATGTITAATLNAGCAGLSAGDVIEVDIKLMDNNGAPDYADVGYVSQAYNN